MLNDAAGLYCKLPGLFVGVRLRFYKRSRLLPTETAISCRLVAPSRFGSI